MWRERVALDLSSRECRPDLLVVLQLNAGTLFSTATSGSRTLSCRSDLDRMCTYLSLDVAA